MPPADLLTVSLRAASACLGLAFASGLVLAGIRFASDRASPPWLAKLHGFAAAAGLGLLLTAWAHAALPSGAQWGAGLLLLAACGGVALNLGYHQRGRPLPEGLVFAHMSLAFVGVLMVGLQALVAGG